MQFEDYPMQITALSEEEGGGYLVTFPDLVGCIADGETIEEAINEAKDAFKAWTMAEQHNIDEQQPLKSLTNLVANPKLNSLTSDPVELQRPMRDDWG